MAAHLGPLPHLAARAHALAWVLLPLCVGCELPIDEACERYAQCQSAFDAAFDLPPTDLDAFDPGGACWQLPQTRARCVAICEVTLRELAAAARAAGGELPACQ